MGPTPWNHMVGFQYPSRRLGPQGALALGRRHLRGQACGLGPWHLGQPFRVRLPGFPRPTFSASLCSAAAHTSATQPDWSWSWGRGRALCRIAATSLFLLVTQTSPQGAGMLEISLACVGRLSLLLLVPRRSSQLTRGLGCHLAPFRASMSSPSPTRLRSGATQPGPGALLAAHRPYLLLSRQPSPHPVHSVCCLLRPPHRAPQPAWPPLPLLGQLALSLPSTRSSSVVLSSSGTRSHRPAAALGPALLSSPLSGRDRPSEDKWPV